MEFLEFIVENGEIEMFLEELWEYKEEISEVELGGGFLGDGRLLEESVYEMMEEEEEILKFKFVVVLLGVFKKEYVNVVFIGYVDVGKLIIGG